MVTRMKKALSPSIVSVTEPKPVIKGRITGAVSLPKITLTAGTEVTSTIPNEISNAA